MTRPRYSVDHRFGPKDRRESIETETPTNEHRRWFWAACLLPLAVALLFAQREVDSPNVSSRMDTIQSLVERRTFCIDQSLRKFDVDVVRIEGRFYSDKPPLLAVVGAGVYLPLHSIFGLSFAKHAAWLYHILTVVLVGVPLAFGLWLLGRCLMLAELDSRTAAITVFLTGLGTMLLPYAVTFNNHVPAAVAITATFYAMLRAESERDSGLRRAQSSRSKRAALQSSAPATRWLFGAGFAGALAFNFDLAPGGVALLGFAALAFWRGSRWRDLAFYGAGVVGPILLYFVFNGLVTHDLIPIYLHPQYYQYEGSILLSYDALKRPYGKTFAGQLFHMCIGYRGFFLYSPILLFGLWETVRQAVRGGRYRPHAWVALAVPVLSACSYATQTGGMAGGSYGMRWLLPATPLFAFFMGLAWARLTARGMRHVFSVAAAVSIAIAAIGVPRPWSSNIRSPLTFLDNIAYFAQVLWPPAKPPVYWIVERTSLEKGYAYFEIGRWHMNHRFYREAIADLERARELDAQEQRPYRPETDYYLGICYDAAGSADLAVAAWERLLAHEPNNAGALNNYARSLLKLGLRSSALAAYRKSLEADPNRASTWRGLGQLYLDVGNRDQAIAHWERALELDPNQADLERQLAETYWQAANAAKALEHLRQLERLRPDDAAIRQAIQRLQDAGTSPPVAAPPPKTR